MTDDQKEFHNFLLIEGIENRVFFTSNEFHTIWNAVEKYITHIAQKNELVKADVSNSVFDCPVCGSEWDTDKHNSCKCGAYIGKH